MANQKELTQKKLKINNNSILIPKKLPKIKDLKELANKSLVLALGPIALLSFLGYKIKSKKVESILNFFKCALAAKQLADDSKDWLNDLKAGLLTNVTSKILKFAAKTRTNINLKSDLSYIYLLFANEVAPGVIYDLKVLCDKAENSMSKNEPKNKAIILNKLIKPIKTACQKAEKFRNLVLEN